METLAFGIRENLTPGQVETFATGSILPHAKEELKRQWTDPMLVYRGLIACVLASPRPRLGDLRPAEIRVIQSRVNAAGRPLEVVGSAARGTRRGVGTNLHIGKEKGVTRSDIDYAIPPSTSEFFDSVGPLPDRIEFAPTIHSPMEGPSIRFAPHSRPIFIPKIGDEPLYGPAPVIESLVPLAVPPAIRPNTDPRE
ncbi:MAG: hypothetical protein JNL58_15530 [Planctomyces sp.]|nr:hypothetical protein [Planctomyces sp.]